MVHAGDHPKFSIYLPNVNQICLLLSLYGHSQIHNANKQAVTISELQFALASEFILILSLIHASLLEISYRLTDLVNILRNKILIYLLPNNCKSASKWFEIFFSSLAGPLHNPFRCGTGAKIRWNKKVWNSNFRRVNETWIEQERNI